MDLQSWPRMCVPCAGGNEPHVAPCLEPPVEFQPSSIIIGDPRVMEIRHRRKHEVGLSAFTMCSRRGLLPH
jgi:hypothetical protein